MQIARHSGQQPRHRAAWGVRGSAASGGGARAAAGHAAV